MKLFADICCYIFRSRDVIFILPVEMKQNISLKIAPNDIQLNFIPKFEYINNNSDNNNKNIWSEEEEAGNS